MRRKFWGWGSADISVDQKLLDRFLPFIVQSFGVDPSKRIPVPRLEEVNIVSSRFTLPDDISSFTTGNKEDRLSHTYGKSYRDIWRALHNHWSHPPDYVSFPTSEDDLQRLIHFAIQENIALIPYGGGSSVCGGVESPMNHPNEGVISVDMKNFDKILEVNVADRTAVMEAGMYGPAIEQGLKPHGFTLRHFPQSFEFSTLGGWIATRSGGHFATLHTHIDDFVQSIRVLTPSGIIDTPTIPTDGAGPNMNSLYCGSEGAFGFITRATMRLQHMPRYKQTKTIYFTDFHRGVEACRMIAQSGLHPANARLIDPMEAFINGLGDGTHTALILGFESHSADVQTLMQEAVQIAESSGGEVQQEDEKKGRRSDAWKSAFLQAPYLRDELIRYGIIAETFETVTTWSNFDHFHKEVLRACQEAVNSYCGSGFVTTRFTHLYPDGPAPYFSVIAKGEEGKQLEQWDTIKQIVSSKIVELGGSITHHHAVGKDHRPYFESQHSDLSVDVLRAIKNRLDPAGVMNPQTLLPTD